ncbi:type II secretion system minor pseudopilin GspK [Microbulbifer sp. TYP-18]|uniref:type II secretion system minor pseudopilin GspK n=1 Tax=Microbulbifer sp. TYP-18 TaxID=3230024 RepID=UPI0034C61079
MGSVGLSHQRGVALITVLLVLVIAVAAVSQAIVRNRIAVSRTAALLANTQLAEFVGGAEAWARVALERDYEEDREQSPSSDSMQEGWAGPALSFNPENGRIRINIQDLHSCFNVNNLAGPGAGQADQAQIFQRLVVNVTGKPELAKAILDWLDPGDTPLAPGTEDDGYLGLEMAHRTPDTLISDVSELAAVQGMEGEDWQALRPYLCALPAEGTAINVNFASEALLEAVDPQARVEDVMSFRDSEGVFNEQAQLQDFGFQQTQALAFHSQYFLARIAVQLGEGEEYRQYWESMIYLDEAKGEAKVMQRHRRNFDIAYMRELLSFEAEGPDNSDNNAN